MRMLVTGGAGFIGSHLSEALLDLGHDVTIVDSFTDYYSTDLKDAHVAGPVERGASLVRGDLNEIELDPLLDGIDVVFHLAGQPGVRASWGHEFDVYLDRNVRATQALLEASARSSSLKRLVFSSSSSVYGDAESYPTSELVRPQPKSPYGVTKLAAEHLCSLYAATLGVPSVSLRYFTVYGPRQRPDMGFHRFISAALADKEITLYGDGSQVRDFTFVADVVTANIEVAQSTGLEAGTVLNVAGGSHASVNEVLGLIGELAGRPLKVAKHPVALGDVLRTGADSSRISATVGWSPKTTLARGLEQQFAYLAARQH